MAEFYTSTDKSKLDIDLIADFLSNRSYWARGRSREKIERSIRNTLCFGVYDENNKQVGFARVLSDFAVFAWIMDVFILEQYRGRGVGKVVDESHHGACRPSGFGAMGTGDEGCPWLVCAIRVQTAEDTGDEDGEDGSADGVLRANRYLSCVSRMAGPPFDGFYVYLITEYKQ